MNYERWCHYSKGILLKLGIKALKLDDYIWWVEIKDEVSPEQDDKEGPHSCESSWKMLKAHRYDPTNEDNDCVQMVKLIAIFSWRITLRNISAWLSCLSVKRLLVDPVRIEGIVRDVDTFDSFKSVTGLTHIMTVCPNRFLTLILNLAFREVISILITRAFRVPSFHIYKYTD
jgi:hypothetical protein